MIDSHILGYYEQHFSAQVGDALDVTPYEFVMTTLVTLKGNENLQSISSLEDVCATIFDIDSLNALLLDCFTAKLFQLC